MTLVHKNNNNNNNNSSNFQHFIAIYAIRFCGSGKFRWDVEPLYISRHPLAQRLNAKFRT